MFGSYTSQLGLYILQPPFCNQCVGGFCFSLIHVVALIVNCSQVLKTLIGNNLIEKQLQEIVDKTILYSHKDGDGKISYEEFCDVSYSVNTFCTCTCKVFDSSCQCTYLQILYGVPLSNGIVSALYVWSPCRLFSETLVPPSVVHCCLQVVGTMDVLSKMVLDSSKATDKHKHRIHLDCQIQSVFIMCIFPLYHAIFYSSYHQIVGQYNQQLISSSMHAIWK